MYVRLGCGSSPRPALGSVCWQAHVSGVPLSFAEISSSDQRPEHPEKQLQSIIIHMLLEIFKQAGTRNVFLGHLLQGCRMLLSRSRWTRLSWSCALSACCNQSCAQTSSELAMACL